MKSGVDEERMKTLKSEHRFWRRHAELQEEKALQKAARLARKE